MTQSAGRLRGRLPPLALLPALAGMVLPAMAQPDLSQMAGVPLPSGDLAAGTVSVRVVGDSLSDNIPGVAVELDAAGERREGVTDEAGRALFSGLPPGATVQVSARRGDRTSASQRFAMPPAQGVRLLLTLGSGVGAAPDVLRGPSPPAAPVRPGELVLGEATRFVIEIVEGGLEVYSLLQFSNPANAPVDPGTPLRIDAPAAATGVTLLEGSSAQATVSGREVTVKGPFAPGATMVQMAYRLPIDGARMRVEQVVPATLRQTSLFVRQVGGIELDSPQIATRREVPVENRTYILTSGPGLAAGGTLAVELAGLPAHPAWPRVAALGLAGLIVVAGIWLAQAPRRSSGPERARLEGRRDSLLDQLARLDDQWADHPAGDPSYLARRQALVARLERVYLSLDGLGAS